MPKPSPSTTTTTHDEENLESVFDDNPTDLNESSTDLKFRRAYASTNQVVHRALSTVSANQTLVHQQRNLLAKNYRRISVNDEIVTIDHADADASFLLPNLFDLPDEIRIRVTDSLVDTTTMNTLEENKRLNWWMNKKLPCPKLYPLLTSGDGNCLLHATSLAMWGFHDHSLSMRKALNETMVTLKPNNSLYRRWRWAQSVQNKKYGLVFSEQEWNEEWKGLLRLSSAEPRISQISAPDSTTATNNQQVNRTKSLPLVSSSTTGGSTSSTCQSTRQYYESLEEFHVYVLANNIRRPIIIYSDRVLRTNDGEAISPIEFGGIYLPLEIPAEKCHKQPVFLAFDAAHFSALVPLEQNSKTSNKATYRIPLIDIETNDLLPIHYFVDPGPDFVWPNDEELSDEKIHLYTHFGPSRMEVLGSYLNLSEELCPLTQLNSLTGSISQASEESGTFANEPSRSSTIPTDASTISHETTNSPLTQKKSSRQTLNTFSKIIRRTFIEPFSTGKRGSFKLRRHQENSDVTLTDQSELRRRISSPLLNPRTNVLKIIMADFQPKRPKTSDNMIKNYIDACMNEYRLEKNRQKTIDVAHDENHRSTTTRIRTYTSTNSETTNNNTHDKRRVVPLSTNGINAVNKPVQKNYDVDDNDDDSSLVDTIPLSSNINYVQKQSATIIQSNSLEMTQNRPRPTESHPPNGLLASRIKPNQVNDASVSRSNIQPVNLKRQQSVDYDRRRQQPQSNRRSIRINIIPNTSQRSSQENPSRGIKTDSMKRS